MRLSKFTIQGVRCLIYLAGATGLVPASELAVSIGAPHKSISKVLLPFRREGLVGAMTGTTGGFYLRVSPYSITLLDAVSISEGCKSLGDCFADDMCFVGGTQDVNTLKEIMGQGGNALDNAMRGVTIAQLARLPELSENKT